MSVIVVDASVGIKWFVPEVHAAEARQWRSGRDELHVPAFFFDLEIHNILWKKLRRAEITRADVDQILAQLSELPLTRQPEWPLLASAFNLADRTQRTVYDCLYLSLQRVEKGGQAPAGTLNSRGKSMCAGASPRFSTACLAVQLSGRMVTADQRLYNSLMGTPWAGYICWVRDIPIGL